MRGGRRNVAKEQFWREAIDKQSTSGFNIRAFCLQHDQSESGFLAWRRNWALRESEGRIVAAVLRA